MCTVCFCKCKGGGCCVASPWWFSLISLIELGWKVAGCSSPPSSGCDLGWACCLGRGVGKILNRIELSSTRSCTELLIMLAHLARNILILAHVSSFNVTEFIKCLLTLEDWALSILTLWEILRHTLVFFFSQVSKNICCIQVFLGVCSEWGKW